MKQRTTLADFLRSLPQGTILYSPLCGYVKVWEVNDSGIVVVLPENHGPELPDTDRKSTRLNSSHSAKSRMPSSA